MSTRQCALVLLFLGFLLTTAKPLQAQTPTRQLWRITFSDQADLNRLASELDVWEVNHLEQWLLAPLTSEEATAVGQTHALTLAADQSPLDPAPVVTSNLNGIPGYECYRTVDETYAALDQLADDYPGLVAQVDIGDSWDKTQAGGPPGDDLRVTIVSNQAIPGPKFRFLLMGAMHAREYTTAELALRFVETLLDGYGRDADATWLLDYGELHLLTLANPDGRRAAETGVLWRKNRNSDQCTDSTFGVDLNRNSTFRWNECQGLTCSSANSCAQTFRGVAPSSEPEVTSIEAYIRSIFPDQRGDGLDDRAPDTTSGLFITLHSYGEKVLFPWGWTTTHAPNGLGLATLARHLGFPLNYVICQAGGAGCLYQTDGTTDDFTYGVLGIPSFTYELGTAFFQACSTFEDTIAQPGLASLRYAFTAAPLPYLLPQGPDVLDLVSVPSAQMPETHVTISATLDSERVAPLSGSDIAPIVEPIERVQAARLTIDELPWIESTFAYPLAAADGSFDTVQETISTTLEIACLPSGRHTLYLQGMDEGDDWGIVAATFVTVTNASEFAASLLAGEGTIKVGESITYTLQLTNTSAATATYSIETNQAFGIDTDIITIPAQPITLAAGANTQIAIIVTPQSNTAGVTLPTVLNIRSDVSPSQCRQVQIATTINAWNYRQRLLIIGNH